jgi:hypothetical protein
MVPATSNWLAAFTVCPAPAGPTRTMVLPIAASSGRARSTSASAPPAMIDRVPSTAPASPPLTGASTTARPCPEPSAASRTATSGRIVEQSTCSVPGLAVA